MAPVVKLDYICNFLFVASMLYCKAPLEYFCPFATLKSGKIPKSSSNVAFLHLCRPSQNVTYRHLPMMRSNRFRKKNLLLSRPKLNLQSGISALFCTCYDYILYSCCSRPYLPGAKDQHNSFETIICFD